MAKIDYRVYNPAVMGFLEDLRRKNAEEKRAAEGAAEQERVGRLQLQSREAEREVQEKENMRKRFEQANQHFQRSEYPRLLKELLSVLSGSFIKTPWGDDGIDVGSYYDLTKWSDEEVKNGRQASVAEVTKRGDDKLDLSISDYSIDFCLQTNKQPIFGLMLIWPVSYGEYNTVPIICSADGTITLGIRKSKKKLFGEELVKEIELPVSVWRGNLGVQEEILGEAYRNPRLLHVDFSSNFVSYTRDEPGG